MDHQIASPEPHKPFLPASVQGIAPMRHFNFPRAEESQRGMLSEYIKVIKRRRLLIGVCALAGLVVSILAGLISIPVYTTRTSLEISERQ